jgi:hypothetical protein
VGRIVFVTHGNAAVLGQLAGKPKPLGKAKSGVWLELADDALLAAWALGAKLDLLWFSRAAYDHAVRKLDEKETGLAVEARHQTFTPEALNQTTAWLGERARLALALAAAKTPAHVERVLGQLVVLETENRFDMLTPREKVFLLVEAEAQLIEELGELRADRKDEISARKTFYRELAKEMEGLGQKGLVDAPLHVPLSRVYAIAPAGTLERYFKSREEPHTTWDKQLVGAVPHKDAARMKSEGKKLTLLYYAPSHIYRALELTEAQREIELAERAKAPQPDEYLGDLRAELAIVRRALAGSVASVLLRRQIPKETELLVAALKEHPEKGELPAVEKGRAADAKFFAAWAKVAGRGELALGLAAHAAQIERDAKDL